MCPSVLQVYAIDLLGFGGSDKALIDYSIELWAEQVADFCQEFVQTPVTLVGNSIGSLVSLEAAQRMKNAEDGPEVQGIALINCAGVFFAPQASILAHCFAMHRTQLASS
jgi:pimeloyl-ACP methyl ester carboxylesterase